jgi:hypothetical protein
LDKIDLSQLEPKAKAQLLKEEAPVKETPKPQVQRNISLKLQSLNQNQ